MLSVFRDFAGRVGECVDLPEGFPDRSLVIPPIRAAYATNRNQL